MLAPAAVTTLDSVHKPVDWCQWPHAEADILDSGSVLVHRAAHEVDSKVASNLHLVDNLIVAIDN